VFKSGVRKVTGALFFTYVAGYAILVVWSFIFPSYAVLSGFFAQTAFLQGTLGFLDYLIPIHSAGLLIAYSLLLSSESKQLERSTPDFKTVISPAVVLLVVLTLGYTLAVIWWKPLIENSIRTNVTKSVIARNFFEKAKASYFDKDYPGAATYIRYSLSIEPAWNEAIALDRQVRKNIISVDTDETGKRAGTRTEAEESEILYSELSEGQNINQIMEKAQGYYRAGNYYSSYYWATLAQKLAPARSDAKTIAVESINRITANELNSKEQGVREFYRKKHDGYTALLNRDYLTAYYIFNDLKKKYPDDKDVAEYFAKIARVVNALSFFTDEVKNLEAFPGYENILFLNRETDTLREFVWIGSMIEVAEGTYFRNVEAIKISKNGNVLSHMKAQYGKYTHASVIKEATGAETGNSDTFINFNCIDRDNPAIRIAPVYLKREAGNQILGNYLNISPVLTDLPNYRVFDNVASSSSWTGLIALKLDSSLVKGGYSDFGIESEILVRTIYPFAFLIFSVLSMTIGWVFRSRYAMRPPVISYFFIPVFPIVLAIFVNLYVYMSTAISGLSLMLFGFFMGLIVTIVIQSVILIISFVIMAGKITD
jgi:hypothetical protein